MTGKFFITSLPRSRTAWWAVAATTAESSCVHEPLKATSKFRDLQAIWDVAGTKHRGVSDSGLSVQLGRILLDIGPKTLIVQRDPRDAMDSLVRYLPWRPIDYVSLHAHLQQCQAAIDEWKAHPLVKVVPYDALAYEDVVRDCFSWIIPGGGRLFDRELLKMNIQVSPEALLADLAAFSNHNQWHLK